MRRGVQKIFIIGGMLLGLPMLGIITSRLPLSPYLEFPPETRYVIKSPYSLPVFTGLALVIILVLLPFVHRVIWAVKRSSPFQKSTQPFPWWGWLAVLSLVSSWVLAWNRFAWFVVFQPHTFPMLWFSFIILLNAIKYRRTGRCLLTHRTRFFLWLFPLSALFWWFFEYLNRFVQNWHYSGVHYGPWQYFWLATLSFSTVLPVVLSMSDWLLSFSWVEKGFSDFVVIRLSRPKVLAGCVFVLAGCSLFLIGIFPNFLFPLLWVSPLLVMVSLQALLRETHVLQRIEKGDWQFVIASALAALICGFFWEMWNIHSLSKWTYSIPLVDRFRIFEMPILGYLGYLPFGLECTAVSLLLADKITSE